MKSQPSVHFFAPTKQGSSPAKHSMSMEGREPFNSPRLGAFQVSQSVADLRDYPA